MKQPSVETKILKLLNWMHKHKDPSYYASVDNVKVYSREFLESVNPKDTMKKFLADMDRMDRCMRSGGNCIIKGDIVYKDVDAEDMGREL